MNAGERLLLFLLTGAIAALLVVGAGYWALQRKVDRQYWQGRMLLHERQYEEAAAVFEQLGRFRDCPALFDDASYRLNMQQGEQALADARYAQAVHYFTTAVKFDPQSTEVAVKLEEAIVLKRRENRRTAWQRVKQGDWYLQQGQPSVAYATYKEAIQYDQDMLSWLKPKIDRARAAMGNGQPVVASLPLPPAPGPVTHYDGEPVGIAVGERQVTTQLQLNEITTRQARGNYRYVKLWVAVKNRSKEYVYVNPHEFTLAAGGSPAVPHENDTYALARYFDGTDLSPGGTTAGWLVFLVTEDRKYMLHYYGTAGEAKTTVVP
jgi:tetratricopeptide (TPR) repeat protein